MEKRTLGLLAHVDGGKTTLSEAMLYTAGAIRRAGRVDKGSALLDFDDMERSRGITIFAREAAFTWKDTRFTLLDTPGHGDFGAEMERTLPALDCALLLISGTDGPQPYTRTLWELLRGRGIPVFVFVTKMDISPYTPQEHMQLLEKEFGGGFMDFSRPVPMEELALLEEEAMERYLSSGTLEREDIRRLIARRLLFPVAFGSGLRQQGIDALLDLLEQYCPAPRYREEKSALVFKVERDREGRRLTHVKVLGGTFRIKENLSYRQKNGETREEKLQEIRFYGGERYTAAEEALPGDVCVFTGLTASRPGGYIGAEGEKNPSRLTPSLSYRLVLPKGCDPVRLMPRLRELEEEEPALGLTFSQRLGEIRVQLMGQVQIDVFKSLLKRRLGVDAELDEGAVLYKETVAAPVLCAGHFEPLRHYGEVHLLLEPLPRGSGILYESLCPEDMLTRNWQNLVLSQLAARPSAGVLTGSPLTDMKITLTGGRTHVKQTEGGDMGEAAGRALRQGLMKAGCRLLEPWYAFSMELPASLLGRAMGDIRRMGGVMEAPVQKGAAMLLRGRCPVASMGNYAREFLSYTRGEGRFWCRADGYDLCHDPEAVIARMAYDPGRDVEHPADSVFCVHGTGETVSWREADNYMHAQSAVHFRKGEETVHRRVNLEERELREILRREFGEERPELYRAPESRPQETETEAPPREQIPWLLVDGYNLLYAWEELRTLAKGSLEAARTRLMDEMSNYCGFTGSAMVLVFDGRGGESKGENRFVYHGVHVAFTPAGVSADGYLQTLLEEIGPNHAVRLVTGDGLIQLAAVGAGVLRTSSREFEKECREVFRRMDDLLRQRQRALPNRLRLPEDEKKEE